MHTAHSNDGTNFFRWYKHRWDWTDTILTFFSVSSDDLHRCYIKVYYVRTVSLPDIDAAFENDYCIQITEIGFRWEVLGLSRDGVCNDLFENLSVNNWKPDLSNATTFDPSFFSLVNTFKFRHSFICSARRSSSILVDFWTECNLTISCWLSKLSHMIVNEKPWHLFGDWIKSSQDGTRKSK